MKKILLSLSVAFAISSINIDGALAYLPVEIINDTDFTFKGTVTYAGCPSSRFEIGPRWHGEKKTKPVADAMGSSFVGDLLYRAANMPTELPDSGLAKKLAKPVGQVNGRNVKKIEFGLLITGSKVLGVFEQLGGPKDWVAWDNNGNPPEKLVETHRDEWSVYLTNLAGKKLRIDLFSKKIFVNEKPVLGVKSQSNQSQQATSDMPVDFGERRFLPNVPEAFNISRYGNQVIGRRIWTDSSRGAFGWCLVTGINGALIDKNKKLVRTNMMGGGVIGYDSSGSIFSNFRLQSWGSGYRVFSYNELLTKMAATSIGKSPGFYFVNATDWPIAYSINQVGCLYHDVILPESSGPSTRRVDTGAVWFTLKFQVSPSQKDPTTDGDCVRSVSIFTAQVLFGAAVQAVTAGGGASFIAAVQGIASQSLGTAARSVITSAAVQIGAKFVASQALINAGSYAVDDPATSALLMAAGAALSANTSKQKPPVTRLRSGAITGWTPPSVITELKAGAQAVVGAVNEVSRYGTKVVQTLSLHSLVAAVMQEKMGQLNPEEQKNFLLNAQNYTDAFNDAKVQKALQNKFGTMALSFGDKTTGGGSGFAGLTMKGQYAGPPAPFRCKYMPSYLIYGGPKFSFNGVTGSLELKSNPLKVTKINNCGLAMMPGASLNGSSPVDFPTFGSDGDGRIGYYASIDCSHKDIETGNQSKKLQVVWWSGKIKIGESNFDGRWCLGGVLGRDNKPIVRMSAETNTKIRNRPVGTLGTLSQGSGLTHFTIENKESGNYYIDQMHVYAFSQHAYCRYSGPRKDEKWGQSGSCDFYEIPLLDDAANEVRFGGPNGRVYCLNGTGAIPPIPNLAAHVSSAGCPAQMKFDVKKLRVTVSKKVSEDFKAEVIKKRWDKLQRKIERINFTKTILGEMDLKNEMIMPSNVAYIQYDEGMFYYDRYLKSWSGWDDLLSEHHLRNWIKMKSTKQGELQLQHTASKETVTIDLFSKNIKWSPSGKRKTIEKLLRRPQTEKPDWEGTFESLLLSNTYGQRGYAPTGATAASGPRSKKQCLDSAVNNGAQFFYWIEKGVSSNVPQCYIYTKLREDKIPENWQKVPDSFQIFTYGVNDAAKQRFTYRTAPDIGWRYGQRP